MLELRTYGLQSLHFTTAKENKGHDASFSAFFCLFLPSFNPFPNKPWFLLVYSTCLLKTMWEKEKLLITSNFSFSRIVFYPFGELSAIFIKFEIVICKFFQFGRVINLSFGKGLIPLISMILKSPLSLFTKWQNLALIQWETCPDNKMNVPEILTLHLICRF